jgi:WD40 repeat protein
MDAFHRRTAGWIVLVQVLVVGTILLVAPPFHDVPVHPAAPVDAAPAMPAPAVPAPAPPEPTAAAPLAPERTIAAPGRLRGLALSPDGVSVAASGDSKVWIWNVTNGDPIATIDLGGCGGTDLAYHPLRSLLAVGCRDGRVWLWESSDRPLAMLRTAHRGQITDVTFGPDGRLLATASADGTVEIWEVEHRERVGGPIDVEAISPGTRRVGGVHSVAFDPGGTMLAIPGGQRVSIWTIAERAVTRATYIGDLAVSVAYTSDGRGLLIGTAVGSVLSRWLNDQIAVGPTATGGDGFVYRVAWAGGRYVLGGSGRTVEVWDHAGGGPSVSLRGGPAFAVSRDNKMIATFEPDGSTLLLWSTRTVMPYLR